MRRGQCSCITNAIVRGLGLCRDGRREGTVNGSLSASQLFVRDTTSGFVTTMVFLPYRLLQLIFVSLSDTQQC